MRVPLRVGLSLGAALLTVSFTACASRRTTASTTPSGTTTTSSTSSTSPRTDEGQVAAAQQEAAHGEDIVRLNNAVTAFDEIMGAPDKGIPQNLLDKAQCVVIVPGMKKGALGIGAQYGKGYFSCRKQGGEGWTAPGAVRMEGGSLGFQIGAQETDIVMLVMNPRGEDRLLSSQFTLGADAAVAAGPVGRQATADTDAYMTAEILSWSRSRGAFAGISLKGSTLREDLQDNQALYGRALTNRDIIQGNVAVPQPAQGFVQMLEKHSPRQVS